VPLKPAASPRQVSALRNPRPRIGRYRYLTLLLITTALTLAVGDRVAVSVLAPSLARDLHLDPIAVGWMLSAFAWSYVLAHLPAGWLVDRLGPKAAILGGLLLCAGASLLASGIGTISGPFIGAVSGAFAALLLLRVLVGVLQAPIGPASAGIIAAWFPGSERGIAGSVFSSASYIALVLFNPLIGWLDQRYGWAVAFNVLGLLGLGMALWWAWQFHLPSRHPKLTRREYDLIAQGGGLVHYGTPIARAPGAAQPRAGWGTLLQVCGNRMMLGICLAQYCITSITWFFISWFPTWLIQGRGYSVAEAGSLAALPAAFGFIGGIAAGFASDQLLKRTGSLNIARKTPVVLGMLLCCAIVGCNLVESKGALATLICLAFFGKGLGTLGWTLIADTAPPSLIGMMSGVFNAVGNMAGIVMPLAIGYLVAATGSFDIALWFVAAHAVAGLLCHLVIVGPIRRLGERV
jgi:MFS transporter, ACS family, glucarate transporter